MFNLFLHSVVRPRSQITPERPQVTQDHTISSKSYAFGTYFLYWALPNNFSSLSHSQIWVKFVHPTTGSEFDIPNFEFELQIPVFGYNLDAKSILVIHL